ncbi:MAG: hypothetical protein PHH71_01465 [Clostridia bacterium]|jgi:hypothetical protein|nr:hypothetical protein [Clostridia bacterium]MDD3232025.1 hypothetical protein [Clostridia bacterium]MDD4408276.1 hypothetical protein [Clostridia bacterium]
MEIFDIEEDEELQQAFAGLQQVANSIMTDFTLKRSKQEYKELSSLIGQTVRVEYLRSAKISNDRLSSEGVLSQVQPFKGISLKGGTFIPFLDEQRAIINVFEKNGEEKVYDRSHILHSGIKLSNNELFATYKLNVFGTVSPESEALKFEKGNPEPHL